MSRNSNQIGLPSSLSGERSYCRQTVAEARVTSLRIFDNQLVCSNRKKGRLKLAGLGHRGFRFEGLHRQQYDEWRDIQKVYRLVLIDICFVLKISTGQKCNERRNIKKINHLIAVNIADNA